jgi:hypothetical protein
MSLIDWSDHEEMLGLLLEYVSDEARTSRGDPARSAFLETLLDDLENLAGMELEAVEAIAEALDGVRRSQPVEFATDPVLEHLDGSIEELQRIAMQQRTTTV